MKLYFRNEKKPICIEIFIHKFKIYYYIFNFVYEVRQEIFVLQCAANRKSLRTTDRRLSPPYSYDQDDYMGKYGGWGDVLVSTHGTSFCGPGIVPTTQYNYT
jgi:hypothetical protein